MTSELFQNQQRVGLEPATSERRQRLLAEAFAIGRARGRRDRRVLLGAGPQIGGVAAEELGDAAGAERPSM